MNLSVTRERSRPADIVRHVTVIATAILLSSCITSPIWEYGDTKIARTTILQVCENGRIDDLEDGDNQLLKVDGRDGYWFSFVDGWGSRLTERQFRPAPGGADDRSVFAAQLSGQLATSGDAIYAGMGFAFTNPKTPYDISHATGIRFRARGPGRVRFQMPDRNTDPRGDRCTECYNDFGVYLYLLDGWHSYTIPFDRMAQKDGWGDRAPTLDTAGVFAVQWMVDTPSMEFDIWIDDIELVGCDEVRP